MYHCYFPAFDYFSQEVFDSYHLAREWGHSKGFSFSVFQRVSNEWVKVKI